MLAVLHSGDTFSNGVIRGHSPYTYNIQFTRGRSFHINYIGRQHDVSYIGR